MPLAVTGGGTKALPGPHHAGGAAPTCPSHRGIVTYEPTELVLSARGGTPLARRSTPHCSRARGQMLAFEPPGFGEAATVGGTIATGLSGPARPYAGAARDFVLGTRVLNGKGEVLRFGGEVMKNVAGYDVSRLMTGAWGTLGVLLEVSLKVLPLPAVGAHPRIRHARGGGDPAMQRVGRKAVSRSPVRATTASVPARAARGHRTAASRRRQAALGGETADGDDVLDRASRADAAFLRKGR